jgi:hypothetical protein
MFLVLTLACTTESDPPPGKKEDAPSPEPADTGTPLPEPEGAWVEAGRLSATLEFQVSALVEAEDAPEACTYRREFDGVEMVGLTDLACSSCRVIYEGMVTVPQEDRACFDSWFPHYTGTTPDRREYWGWSRDDFYRSTYPNPTPMGAEDFVMPKDGEAGSFTYQTATSGAADAQLVVTGALQVTEAVRVPDPVALARESYLCGWPVGNDGSVPQPRSIMLDGAVPELPMVDACGEPLSIRDLMGEWVLFVSAKPDCPSCVYTALEMHTWAATATQPVRVVTLFDGDDGEFAQALVDYGAIGPVLRNRGYTQLMGLYLAGTLEPASAWWLVDPTQVVRVAGRGIPQDLSNLNEVM